MRYVLRISPTELYKATECELKVRANDLNVIGFVKNCVKLLFNLFRSYRLRGFGDTAGVRTFNVTGSLGGPFVQKCGIRKLCLWLDEPSTNAILFLPNESSTHESFTMLRYLLLRFRHQPFHGVWFGLRRRRVQIRDTLACHRHTCSIRSWRWERHTITFVLRSVP